MSQKVEETQAMKTEEKAIESHSLWTLPSDKWTNPFQGKNITFSSDMSALKDHMENFKQKLKAFETPVSVESLNYIVK